MSRKKHCFCGKESYTEKPKIKFLYEKDNHLGNVHVVFTTTLTDSIYFTDIEEENEPHFQRVESLREEIEIPQPRSGSYVARLNAAEQLEDGSSRGIGPVLNLREVKEGERLRLSIWHYEEPAQAPAAAPQNANLWNNLQAPLFGISLQDKNELERRKWQGIHLNLLSVVPLLKNSKQRNVSKARNISARTRPVFIGGNVDLSHLVVEKWSSDGEIIDTEQYPLEDLSPLAEEGQWVETKASYEIGECEGCSIKTYVQTVAERDLLIEDFEVVHEREQLKVVNTKSYYPFGSLLSYAEDSTLSTTANGRRNYQAEYAEWDEESSNYHFTLRLLDPVIGRWLSVDPYRQFYSPYVGMGNDPVNGVDPDGGAWKPGKNGSLIAEAGDNASTLAEYLNVSFDEANSIYSNLSNWEGGAFLDFGIDNITGLSLNTFNIPSSNIIQAQAGFFTLDLIDNIGTGITVESLALKSFYARAGAYLFKGGSSATVLANKMLNGVGTGANFLGSFVVATRIGKGYYSPENGKTKPLEAAGDAAFNLAGYTGVGTPLSLGYFLGVKPTMQSYTNRIMNNSAFQRSEFQKATSLDTRFDGGIK